MIELYPICYFYPQQYAERVIVMSNYGTIIDKQIAVSAIWFQIDFQQ